MPARGGAFAGGGPLFLSRHAGRRRARPQRNGRGGGRGPAAACNRVTAAVEGFLQISRGSTPLLVSIPHTGTEIPPEIEARLVSPWLARKDTDWWIEDRKRVV